MVERFLMEEKEYPVAKAYMIYREQHAVMRRIAQDPMALIDKYINNRDWQVRENRNIAYSLQGLNNHVASDMVRATGSSISILRKCVSRTRAAISTCVTSTRSRVCIASGGTSLIC